MQRDLDTYKKWEEWHRLTSLEEFERAKSKAIQDALNMEDLKIREIMFLKAQKMKFQFDKSKLTNYGRCAKFNKPVSFRPGICQIETQKCFIHRKDVA